ncbi:hypothetical protein PLESTB_001098400 [Pleodorina starrii]|uniref:Uncharacterized protein n=1 Tax=Pleodorina starrii TaxID=330485 RepID=A0A9W6BQJ9_9CHLO|nr:hypothetical protein PLESTM_001333000 [Pleodorina starrii]GLC56379.1 hypothetical protein PLESTB_001098400 [Pleodorina starrii]GLC69292.1 hypothetical protein PLESTF_000812300 [Pleodorina starrii]
MPKISVEGALSGSEAGEEAPRAGHAASSRALARRHEDSDSGSSAGGAGRAPPVAPMPLQGPHVFMPQQPPRAEPPPYCAALRLFTERYRLHGVSPTDLAVDCVTRLRHAVAWHTGRDMVGVSVQRGPGYSLDVVIDAVETLDHTAAGSTNTGTAAGSSSSSGARRGLSIGAVERRKATSIVAAEEGVFDPELGIHHLEIAVLRRPWLRPRTWVSWARQFFWKMILEDLMPNSSAAQQSYSGRRAGPSAGAGPRSRQKGTAAPGRVIASRITAVAPRVVLLDRAAERFEDQLPPGVGAHGQPLPAGSSAAPPSAACLQVSASLCCSSPSGAAGSVERQCGACGACGGGGNAAGGRSRAEVCRKASCAAALSLEVMLRQGHGFSSVWALSGEARDPGAAAGPSATPKPCRRPQCRQHLALRQDIRLATCDDGYTKWPAPLCSGLGPGLLLLDTRTGAKQRTLAQRPVPVLVLDDPWVAQEVQVALSDKQVTADADNLLVDLGLFVQHIADLRCAAAPVTALADAGLLRSLRTPPCCCWQLSSRGSSGKRCSGFAAGARPSNAGATCHEPPGSGATSASDGPGEAEGAPAFASAAAARAPLCVACELNRLRCTLTRYHLNLNHALSLGESLLRYSTAAGWHRTASYISSCLVDLQRIHVIVDAVLGPDLRFQHDDLKWVDSLIAPVPPGTCGSVLRVIDAFLSDSTSDFVVAAATVAAARSVLTIPRQLREHGLRRTLAEAARQARGWLGPRAAQHVAYVMVLLGSLQLFCVLMDLTHLMMAHTLPFVVPSCKQRSLLVLVAERLVLGYLATWFGEGLMLRFTAAIQAARLGALQAGAGGGRGRAAGALAS